MSYGEKLESTIIRLKVHNEIKESGWQFKHRKGLIEHLFKVHSQDPVLKKELDHLKEHIEMITELKESLKPFITTFYN